MQVFAKVQNLSHAKNIVFKMLIFLNKLLFLSKKNILLVYLHIFDRFQMLVTCQ